MEESEVESCEEPEQIENGFKIIVPVCKYHSFAITLKYCFQSYAGLVYVTIFCRTCIHQRNYMRDNYPNLSEKSHLLCNKNVRYQMNEARCNEELIIPVAEQKLNFFEIQRSL